MDSFGWYVIKFFGQRKMGVFQLHYIFLYVLVCLTCSVNGLKCRTSQDSSQNGDFEYVVRMCLRRLKNESDFPENLYKFQNDYESSRNKRHRDEMSFNNNNNNNNNDNNDNDMNKRNYFGRNQNNGHPDGIKRFWSNDNDRNRYSDEDRNRQDGDYEEGESDYYNGNRHGKEGRKKFKSRPQTPHSYQQQMQHDRDMQFGGYGNKDSTNYFYSHWNKNSKFTFNKDKNSDSPLAEIDPCVIHCIFHEMQMVDDNGKPSKGLISQKMTQKIHNSELKSFIQNSVEECFDAIDDDEDFRNYNNNNSNNRRRKSENMCEWAKTFAMCLEDRGKENCDDWNDPVRNNSNNNNNNNNNKNNEDQKYKSKKNDRG